MRGNMDWKNQRTTKKPCRACGLEKPLTEFYDHASNLDHKHNTCIACHKERCLKRYHARKRPAMPLRRDLLAEVAELRAQVAALVGQEISA